MVGRYDIRRNGIIGFLVISVVIVIGFLYYSDLLVKDLSALERKRMEIWADATREIVKNTSAGAVDDDSSIGFLLSIIEGNTTIPVLLTDENGNIMMHRNFRLPEKIDSTAPLFISDRNREYLQKKYTKLKDSPNIIEIVTDSGDRQYLYYEDSTLLKRLSLYPYIQLLVLLIFVGMVYYAVSSSKRVEQNKVWVGLSKETAHQLGTPISSLAAWLELLEETNTDKGIINDMRKDVGRLSTIASRFSKIGSRPDMVDEDINNVVAKASEYMISRISRKVNFRLMTLEVPAMVNLSIPLFEWVMENLIKNAVDAMDGSGALVIKIDRGENRVYIDISDSGKGIARKNQKVVFRPGYTTKKRGWGLGLTLAKRIIEEYHNGEIYVKYSEIGIGTTFTIALPLLETHKN